MIKWLIIIFLPLLAACDSQFLNNPFLWSAYRYRLTLIADVDGERKIGSSVIQVEYYFGQKSPMSCCEHVVKGTAPIVDLGRYGWLVVPFGPNNLAQWPDTLPGKIPGKPPRYAEVTHIPFLAYGVAYRIAREDLPEVQQRTEKVDLLELWRTGSVRQIPAAFTLPQIIWVPLDVGPDAPLLPLLPEDIPQWIASSVRLIEFTFEPTKEEPVSQVAAAPDWLLNLRAGGRFAKLSTKAKPPDSAPSYRTEIELLAYHIEREGKRQ